MSYVKSPILVRKEYTINFSEVAQVSERYPEEDICHENIENSEMYAIAIVSVDGGSLKAIALILPIGAIYSGCVCGGSVKG